MDEYVKEIRDLRQEVETLVEAEGDQREIRDLEDQIGILDAIYSRAGELFERGREDADLRRRLRTRGYGDWTLDNVYAFVYEQSVELPDASPREFAEEIRETDFADRLEPPVA
jgi:hypothetical protein